ncbi:peptidylprolyl isomerase [Marinobacter sp.]|uniref:peptidylprolyl isomerase n=1 Tax=Marinobacter sp. TaxID=50741 RepID=UPI0034A599D5
MIQVFLLLLVSLIAIQPASADESNRELPQVRMETTEGVIELRLRPDVAPETVENFLDYVRNGFYDGTVFHRVIAGFMIQTGGFDRDLERKDTSASIPNEGSSTLKNLRGSIAMARTSQPHSATSQFFINLVDNSYLDTTDNPKKWGYAVFGQVTSGMGVVDAIAAKPTGYSGGMGDVPQQPVIVERMRIIEPNGQTAD